ncbi:MAG: AraC family transcriptional regulator, partial [Myxococcota bacterium]
DGAAGGLGHGDLPSPTPRRTKRRIVLFMPTGRSDYIARVQRVQDYVERHLAEPLTLPRLAGVAHFSPFHFHRIFAALVGETPSAYVRRIRLEKAASMLQHNEDLGITEVALDCGWQETSSFSRAFRRHFGVPATEWRKKCQANRNDGQVVGASDAVSWRGKEGAMTTQPLTPTSAEVEDRAAFTVAYVRHTGPYAGDASLFEGLFGKLMGWLGARGLMGPQTRTFTIYHDNPEVTDEEHRRISVCATVPADTPVGGEIGRLEFPAGACLVARFALKPTQYGDAWQWVYGQWLPESAYEPDDRFAYEEYLSMPEADGTHHVAVVVPVRPRRD